MGVLTQAPPRASGKQLQALPETVVVWLAYLAVLLLLIPRHEPWFDEAQAWLLARDAGVRGLLGHYLAYEGSPGLWHSLLLIPAKAGVPYGILNYISGLAGLTGVTLLLWKSPFPPVVKYSLPFTFFLLYQYAVVARSYALIPPLLFSLAIIYPSAKERIYTFAVLLALLANVCLHGFVLAFSILAAYMWDSCRDWNSWDVSTRRRHLFALAGLLLVGSVVAVQLQRPHDLVGYGTLNFHVRHLVAVSLIKIGGAFTGNTLLSLGVLVVSCWWFWRTGVLLVFLLGTAMLSGVAGIVYSHVWHEGLLFLFWTFALWLSWERSRRLALQVPAVLIGAVLFVTAVQIYWAARTAVFDFRFPYSGSRDLALYLREVGLDRSSIFGFGAKSISLLPYFDRNVFANYHAGKLPAFWLWSTQNDMDRHIDRIGSDRPASVIVSVPRESDAHVAAVRQTLIKDGYQLKRRFNGALYWKSWIIENDTYEVWTPQA
jgi:hypothetical protein